MAKKSITFNEAVTEIEEILKKLEEGEVDPDTLSIHVKRASDLLKLCNGKLKNTQEEIDSILKDLE